MTNRTDNFNRSDRNLNGDTPSDGGSAWVTTSGGWGITSNTAYQTVGNASSPYYSCCYLESSVSNVTVQATLAAIDSTPPPSDYPGLFVRYADLANTLFVYFGAYFSGSDFFTDVGISKVVSGVETLVASDAQPVLVAGDVLKVKADSSNDITAYINSWSLSTNISDNATNTKHGLFNWADPPADARLDAFSITENSSGGGGGGDSGGAGGVASYNLASVRQRRRRESGR